MDAVHTRSEGNAFFAEELLATGDDGRGLPQSLLDILLSRVEALPESTQRVLRVAAAVGRRVRYDVLVELTGVDEGELDSVLRELVARHLLVPDGDDEAYSFRHALTQEAVYGELLPGERTRLHTAVADALEARRAAEPTAARATSLAELAYHRYAARDHLRAIPALVEAGLAAERVSALAEAAGHFERALELWDGVPDAAERSPLPWVDMVRRAADNASLTGRFERSIALIREAIASVDPVADPVLAGVLHERLGRFLWVAGDDGAVDAYSEAVRLVPADPPTAERARVLAALGQVRMLSGQPTVARAVCEEALAVAVEVGAREQEGHAANSLGTVLVLLGDDSGVELVRRALAIALELRQVDDVARGYTNLSHVLNTLGRHGEAVDAALEGIAYSEGAGISWTYGIFCAFNAIDSLLWLGRWDEVVDLYDWAGPLIPPRAWQTSFSYLQVRVERGEFGPVHEAIESTKHTMSKLSDREQVVRFGTTAASLAVWEGRVGDARTIVADLMGTTPEAFLREWGAQLVQVAVRAEADHAIRSRLLGDTDAVADCDARASGLLDVLRRWLAGPSEDGAVATRDSVCALAFAEAELERLRGGRGVEAWAEAVREAQRWQTPYPEAYARFRQAEAMLNAGLDRGEATLLLGAARSVLRSLGARPLLSEVEALARRARLTFPGEAPAAATDSDTAEDDGTPFGLTPREREVLVLVAAGRTNRQIADELFISVKTAGVHVSNILAKLGVRTRGEAGAAAHTLGLA